jgi:hypothetical protein
MSPLAGLAGCLNARNARICRCPALRPGLTPPGAAASRGSPPDAAVRVGRFLAEFDAMCAVMWPHSGS